MSRMGPPSEERRKHKRLPLSFPAFAYGTGHDGHNFKELLTALNVSSGGMLAMASSRFAPAGSFRIELPIGGKGDLPRPTQREVRAEITRVEQRSRYKLLGIKFAHPVL
jgi:PilZ domain